MRRLATATSILCLSILSPLTASASDLVWEVQSPFRFFKKAAEYAVQERAFDAVRGKADAPLPANIVWRTERRLNDPDCTDKSSPGSLIGIFLFGDSYRLPTLARCRTRERDGARSKKRLSAV